MLPTKPGHDIAKRQATEGDVTSTGTRGADILFGLIVLAIVVLLLVTICFINFVIWFLKNENKRPESSTGIKIKGPQKNQRKESSIAKEKSKLSDKSRKKKDEKGKDGP